MGDIYIKLYPVECPKTVENFTKHSKNGYYDTLLFHRIIKGFMIQTGACRVAESGRLTVYGVI
jgi:peptidylprolyl isomerase domain and WD repeat-containing protein 1